jgi:hypothetical protein
VLGFVLSIVTHAATFAPSLGGVEPWMLNLGVCFVWTPLLVIGTQKIFDITTVGEKWTLIPRHAPEWSKAVGVVLLFYAMVNFLFTMIVLNKGGYPAVVDGQMVLQTYNFGVILRELTPEQYTLHQAYITRALSGHWVFFFWMGILAAHSHLVMSGKWSVLSAPFSARRNATTPLQESVEAVVTDN